MYSLSQDEGNFCGKCGAQFEVQGEDQIAVTTQEKEPAQQTNEQLEKIKEQSKIYFNYFVQQLKTPSGHLTEQNGIKNSVISIAIYVLITVLAVYTFLRRFLGSSYFGYIGPSFFQTFLYVTIFFVLLIGISATAVYLTSKLFLENLKYTVIINRFGGFFAIPILLSLVGLLFALIKSIAVATLCIYTSILVAFGFIPIYVMIKQLSVKSKGIDSFYAYMFYLLVTLVLGGIIAFFITDSALGEMLSYF